MVILFSSRCLGVESDNLGYIPKISIEILRLADKNSSPTHLLTLEPLEDYRNLNPSCLSNYSTYREENEMNDILVAPN